MPNTISAQQNARQTKKDLGATYLILFKLIFATVQICGWQVTNNTSVIAVQNL